jgi:hypothetical protein
VPTLLRGQRCHGQGRERHELLREREHRGAV